MISPACPPVTSEDTNPEIAAQLQQALVMAGMVSLRGDLTVETGSDWAFNWRTNVITIPREDLEKSEPEVVAWIILHEAAHAALTRLQDIMPTNLMEVPEVHFLLNCIEDVRIERWLVERFPGSRPWKDATDRAARADGALAEALGPEAHPVDAFFMGILELGTQGVLPDTMHPEARAALEQVSGALESAFACAPPASSVGADSVRRLYKNHFVSACYRDSDYRREPSTFEKWVRIMQATMWFHVVRNILPVFLELVKKHGASKAPAQMRRQVVVVGAGMSDQPRSPEELERALREKLRGKTNQPYLEAVHRHAAHILGVSRILEELLPNHRALRHVRGRRSGDRIDLRAAFQFEADRRLHDKLWMQRHKPTLPDPAFVFLMDRSSSMSESGKAQAAFDSLVVIREACTRMGIPFSIFLFNEQPLLVQPWDRLSDAALESALSLVLDPDGGTDIPSAINKASEALEGRPECDRVVFVLTDGKVSHHSARLVRRQREQLSRQGISMQGIGLGDEADDVRVVFPDARIVRQAADLPQVLSEGILSSLGGSPFLSPDSDRQ